MNGNCFTKQEYQLIFVMETQNILYEVGADGLNFIYRNFMHQSINTGILGNQVYGSLYG
jgi:hypothetical protein